MVGHLAGEAHFVRHHHHGAAFLGQGAHDAQHLGHQLGVQGAGRFVEQHHLGLHRQRAGDGHPLLLTARHVRRVLVLDVAQPDFFQVFARGGNGLVLAFTQHVHGRFNHVFQHGQVRPEVEVLEHHGQFGPGALQLLFVGGLEHAVLGGDELQLFAGHDDAALLRSLQQVHAAQKSGFARTGRSDDADHVAGLGGQRNAFEHFVRTVALANVQRFEFGSHGGEGQGLSRLPLRMGVLPATRHTSMPAVAQRRLWRA